MYLYQFIPFIVIYTIKLAKCEFISLKHKNTSLFEKDSLLKNKSSLSIDAGISTKQPVSLKEEFGDALFPVRIMVTMRKSETSFLEMESTLKEAVEKSPVSRFEHLSRAGCYMIEMSEDCTKLELDLLIKEIRDLGAVVEFDALASPATVDNNHFTKQDSSDYEDNSDELDPMFSVKYDPKQWHIPEMNVDKAWVKLETLRTREVKVCVVDSGIDYEHPGFSGRLAVDIPSKKTLRRTKRASTDTSNDSSINSQTNSSTKSSIDPQASSFSESSSKPDDEDNENDDKEQKEEPPKGDLLLSANFVDNNFNPMDNYGHGTHISGIIASNSGTSKVAGINPFARIVSCKAFEKGVQARVSNIVRCIDFCIYSKAEVQNHSWIVTKELKFLKKAFYSAYKRDIIMVVAAGNLNSLKKAIPKNNNNLSLDSNYNLNIDDTKQFPAVYSRIYSNVITTANLMILDKSKSKHMMMKCLLKSKDSCREYSHLGLNENSMFGPGSVQIAAPGTKIYSLFPGKSYAISTGTSTSTAVITGVISLIKSLFPNKSNRRISSAHTIQILRESVKVVSNLDGKVGWRGLPDCLSAVNLSITYLKSLEKKPKRFRASNSKVEI